MSWESEGVLGFYMCLCPFHVLLEHPFLLLFAEVLHASGCQSGIILHPCSLMERENPNLIPFKMKLPANFLSNKICFVIQMSIWPSFGSRYSSLCCNFSHQRMDLVQGRITPDGNTQNATLLGFIVKVLQHFLRIFCQHHHHIGNNSVKLVTSIQRLLSIGLLDC